MQLPTSNPPLIDIASWELEVYLVSGLAFLLIFFLFRAYEKTRSANTLKNRARKITKEIKDRLGNIPATYNSGLRKIRGEFSKDIAELDGTSVIILAEYLISRENLPRTFVYELIRHHKSSDKFLSAIESLNDEHLQKLVFNPEHLDQKEGLTDRVREIENRKATDRFAVYLAGPAWRDGRLSEGSVRGWANAEGIWHRRRAVLATIALNSRHPGDAARTIPIFKAAYRPDDEILVRRAQEWALRTLAKADPGANFNAEIRRSSLLKK